MFNRRLRQRLESIEVVLDALIGTLTKKQHLSRDDIQREILETAAKDKKAAK